MEWKDNVYIMEKVKMPLWKWIILLILSPILLIFVYSLFQMCVGFHISQALLCLIYAAGIPVVIGTYMLFEKCYSHLCKQQQNSKIIDKTFFPKTLKGMGIGIAYFCLVVLIMAVIGAYSIQSCQFDAMGLFTAFILFLLVAVSEECIFRGIIFRLIEERWNYWVALIVSCLLFGAAHIFNDEASLRDCLAIAIEAGLLLGAAYKMSGSLWLPIGIHWTWNFMEEDVFGFAVSGNTGISFSIIHPVIKGDAWITGGAFGAEASVIAVLLGFAISCGMIYKICR